MELPPAESLPYLQNSQSNFTKTQSVFDLRPQNLEPEAPKLQSNFVPVLPADVKRQIFGQSPALLQQSQSLSRGMQQTTKQQYLSQLCSRPISQRELKKYLATNPIDVAYIKVRSIEYSEFVDTTYYHYTPTQVSRPDEASFYYSIYTGFAGKTYSGDNYVVSLPFYSTVATEVPARDNVLLDLLTQYRIYQQRLRCIQLDPSFAGNQVRANFNAIINHEFWTWSDNPITAQVKLLAYLKLNSYVLGLQNIERDPTANIEHVDKLQLKAEIQNLIGTIQGVIAGW